MTDASLRRSWVVSATSLALWAVSTVSLVGYMVVLGPSRVQRQVADQLSRRALETGLEPLHVLLGSTIVLGVCAVLSLLYYSYAQWQHVKRRRRRLESSSRTSDADGDRTRVR